jgi:hypothetical protein
MPGVVETTNTFATNDVITSTAMNNIIDQTLFTADALSGGTLALVAGKMKVATSGITSNEMGVGAVTANAIAADAVTTVKILDANVTTAKIADANVTTAKIVDANVTTAKIADASITAPKLNGAQTGTAPIYGVRAWVVFDLTRNAAGGSDTANTTRFLYASGNVTSVTKLATGSFQVNFTTALPNENYAYFGSCRGTDSIPAVMVARSSTGTKTTSAIQLSSVNTAAAVNFTEVSVAIVG